MKKFDPRHSSIFPFSLISLVLIVWPHDALAWGPLAHLHFSTGALEDLSLFSPALRVLLSRHTPDFLYGSLAADIVVGKNLSKYSVHCHNWNVGFSVFDQARTDAQRAFCLGFLAHLSVDTVAHNYYVPYKTVQSFGVRATGHAYWEMRYDQRLPKDLWRMARHVSQACFREHDDHLKLCLSDSHVLPFAISKQMFGGLLLAARLKKWQKLSEVVAGEKELPLHEEEIQECRKLAVGHIVQMLRDGRDARCTDIDPTGGRNLHFADQFKEKLKGIPTLSVKRISRLTHQARASFRMGIYGKLDLPSFSI